MSSKTTKTTKTTKTGKPAKEPCSHRSVVSWPGSVYGSCTACGAGLMRQRMGNAHTWVPLATIARAAKANRTPRRSRNAPSAPSAPTLHTLVQLSLFDGVKG